MSPQGIEAPHGACDGRGKGGAEVLSTPPPGCPVLHLRHGESSSTPVESPQTDRSTPPPVFCKKKLQAIENKGRESEKESQETVRGCKALMGRELKAERPGGVWEVC